MSTTDAAALEDAVRAIYATQAKDSATRSEEAVRAAVALAVGFGYTPEDLKVIPAEALLGLQCGNPVLDAGLVHGETVVDLGSGAGVDVFLAGARVGPTGRAIGVDFGEEMVARAKAAAAASGATNVDFRVGRIQEMPVAADTADCIISNCVINLAPNKMDVFRDMFRVLKPGGRVAVSDVVVTDTPMPAELRKSVLMYAGCVSGAISEAEYRRGLEAAGFTNVSIVNKKTDLNAMWNPTKNKGACLACVATESCGKKPERSATEGAPELAGVDMNDYIYSAMVRAVKPLQ